MLSPNLPQGHRKEARFCWLRSPCTRHRYHGLFGKRVLLQVVRPLTDAPQRLLAIRSEGNSPKTRCSRRPLVQVPVVHHFPRFAQPAFCTSAIFALVAALLFRLPGLPTLRALVCPASTALAACSR
jgi:hypothetical protein